MLLDDRNATAAPTPGQPPRFPPVIEDRPGKTLVVEDRPQATAQERTWPEAIGEFGATVGIPMAATAIATPFLGPFAPVAGAGAGALVELGRQAYYEEPPNLALAGTEALLNLIPGGKAASTIPRNVAKRVVQGVGLGVGGEQARKTIGRGEGWLTPEEALVSGGLGGAFGGVVGAGEGYALRRAAGGAPLVIEDRPGRVPDQPVSSPLTPGNVSPETPPGDLVHGTTAAGEAGIRARGFQPQPHTDRAYRYSELGPDTVYAAPKGSFWYTDPESARALPYDRQLPVELAPEAKVDVWRSDADVAETARKIGVVGPRELLRRLYSDFDDPASMESARATVEALRAAGVDGVYVAEVPGWKTGPAGPQLAVFSPGLLRPKPGDPLPLRETYGPAAPRTGSGQPELFPALPQTKVSTSQTRQDAPGTTQAAPPAVSSDLPPSSRPAQASLQPEPLPGSVPDTRSLADLAASPEAISRVQGEEAAGVQFYRQRQVGGPIEPMPATVDRVDTFAQGDQVVYRLQDGKITIAGTGPDVQRNRLPGTQARFERTLQAQLASPVQGQPARAGLFGTPAAETSPPAPETSSLGFGTRPPRMAQDASIPQGEGGSAPRPESPAGGAAGPRGAGFGPVPPRVPGAGEPPPGVQQGRLSAVDPDRLTKSLSEGLESPDDIQRLRTGIAEQIRNNVEYARRGVVPVEETFREARQYGVEDVLDRKRGAAWNAAELTAARRVNEAQLGNLRTAWQTAHASRADADRVELMRQVYLTHAVLQQNAGASAEAGRALQIHSQFRRDPQLRAIQRAIEKAGGADNIDQVIDDLARFDPNDTAAMARYVGQLAKATVWDKAHEYFLAALVSGTQTHLAQALGNTAYALERPALKVAQVGADIARSAVTGAPRERFAGEVTADLFGMARGIRGGVTAALKALASDDTQTRLDQPIRTAIGGRWGRFVRFPLRALGAGDEFFKAINVQGHLAALAYRQAAREGRHGQAFADRMAEIIARPDAIEGLREALDREALYRTFQTEGGEFTKKLVALRRSTKIGPFIIPFIKTPVNVFKAAVERSPLALVDILQRVKAGTLSGAALSDDLTKAAVGTAIGGAVALAVAEGNVTGYGPADPKERAAWRLTHQPYSFKVPAAAVKALGLKSQWINYGRVEPWGTQMGWAADVATMMQRPDTEVEDAVSKAAFLLGKGIVSKTWMQGVSGFFGAIDDDGKKGGDLEKFIQKFAGAVAVPNVIAQTARAFDPVMRKPRSIGEVLQARAGLGAGIKGYLEEVGPIRDVFGGEVVIPGGPVERAISPIYRSYTRAEDPARREVARLGVAPGSPQRLLSGIKLSPKEYDGYVERSGKVAHQMVTRLVRQPGYQRMSDEDKFDALSRAFAEARAFEREKLKPQVRRRALSEGILPKKQAAR